MTRHTFGATLADFVIIPGDAATVGGVDGFQTLLVPDRVVTFYDAATAGTLIDDLLDLLDTPIDSVTTDSAGSIPGFKGPDDGTRVLWADANAGAGPRALMIATDLGTALDGKLDLAGGTMEGTLRLEDDSPAASQDYVDAHATGGAPNILAFSITGIVSVAAGTARIYNDTGRALTIGTVRASVGTAPVGAALIVDVNLNGTTIYTTQANRPSIASGQVTDTAGDPDVATWPVGEYLTVDVDQVGTTTPGSGLTVTIPST